MAQTRLVQLTPPYEAPKRSLTTALAPHGARTLPHTVARHFEIKYRSKHEFHWTLAKKILFLARYVIHYHYGYSRVRNQPETQLPVLHCPHYIGIITGLLCYQYAMN